jgi:hypothetical protein
MSDGQWSPLNKSCIESSREASSLEGGFESGLCSKVHHVRDPYQLAPPVAFLHLTVDQPRCYLPTFARCALGKPPGATDQSGP